MNEQNHQFPAVFHGEIAQQTQLLCNARELHEFLKSKREFSTWIKDRIKKYGFLENQDFCSFDNFVKRETGGSVRTDYHISLDMAKELAMVENNATGRQIRRYFINCENKIRDKDKCSSAYLEYAQDALSKKSEQIKELTEIIREIEEENIRINNLLTLDEEQRKFIRLIVEHKSKMEDKTTGQIYSLIWQAFGNSYVDCKAWQFGKLCEFLGYETPKHLDLPFLQPKNNLFNLPERLAEIGLNYTYALPK